MTNSTYSALRVLWLPVLLSIFAGCSAPPGPNVEAPMPVADLTTPDRAVKSWWALLDWEAARSARLAQAPGAPSKLLKRAEVTVLTGDMLRWHAEPRDSRVPRIERSIVEVKQETESRAVVLTLAKNVTEPPPGAVPDKYDIERRETGERARYVLEKMTEGWRIAEVQTWDNPLIGNRLVEGWHPYYKVPQSSLPTFVWPL